MNPAPHLAHCQLGYRPQARKTITLVPGPAAASLPPRVPFHLRHFFKRLPRDHAAPDAWQGRYFRWPFDLEKGRPLPEQGTVSFHGELVRMDTRWGPFWQGNFDAFRDEGIHQIETEHGVSFPLTIAPRVHERLQRGFLVYLGAQRSGCEVPGIRPLQNADDARLDSTGEQIAAAGGWYDAGDLRKWVFLTAPNLAALASLATHGHPGLRAAAVEEARWGNRFFHAMVAPDGQVWEDVGGGAFKPGLSIERDWWYENHPGCNANNSDGRDTDNIPGSGDERTVRTQYNPAVQFLFVRTQCQIARVLEPADAATCRIHAARTWRYGRARGHDGRTLFVAEELRAAAELLADGLAGVTPADVEALATELLRRQDHGEGLSGYFLERDGTDAFRCIAMACEPAFALLRVAELRVPELAHVSRQAGEAVRRYIDDYLLVDARSNPFGIGPYGVFLHPPRPDVQAFRDAGRGRGVRTFIPVFGPQQIVHGTGGVIAHQAALAATAARVLQRPDWADAAETWIHWLLGHNPEGLCLHQGVGYRHPVPFSAHVAQVPEAMCVGHVGRPDDSPYVESSRLVEWSTQEIWDIPHGYLVEAAVALG